MTVKKSGSFYSINCYNAQVAVTDTPKSESPRFPDDVKYSTELCLWHQRFGHLASKSIVPIPMKRLVEELPKLDHSLESIAPLCTGCLLGKFDRRPFRPTSKKGGLVFEKVHMDIKGPMDMMSIGKHLYFLILVDDYSGLTVAYPMKRKSDALKFYRGFSEQAWNQTGKRISYPRCDNAKEFLTSAFNENHSTQGTVLQDIPNYTPELNGTVERNIRTVMNMMRSMLKGAGLPKNLWAEAIIAACYIKNRFTSSNKSTPHELWFGTKPDVSGLRIYGCTAFVHVPKEKKKALDDQSEECILTGYGSGNIYRLLTKKTRKLIIARDVKFDDCLLGIGIFRNKVEPLYINDDDDEENKDAQAPIEDVKEPTSEKPAFKIAEEVQPVLRRCSRLRNKGRRQEERRGKERFQRR